ncbi:hypothetical protein Tco_0877229 [Tanacetum coccineum]|uniref:Uncharacterized protein n=1 Tax=Tanacetum coccineum TaxID=301880 RepID=A0ABQ5BXR0_9ASTR
MVIPRTSTAAAPTTPLTIPPITPLPQQSTPTPTPAPTTKTTTILIHALPDFSSLFGFDQRVFVLERDLSQLKQVDYSAQLLETINTITESLENVVLDKYPSQPMSTYKAITSLTEFELKKILLDKMHKSKSYRGAPEHKELYDGLVKSYNLDKDLFDSYEGRQARMQIHQKALNHKIQSQAHPKAPSLSQNNLFKKPERPPTPDSVWNAIKSVDFRPPQTWISKIAQAKKPPLTFDELMSTHIDFSTYVMNNLKIDNLTQEHLVGPTFNLLNGTCRSIEDMVPSVWSPMKVAYDKYVVLGITHWVTHVKVMKWYDYGYLEEIEVRREDQQLYKFKEGDFPRLNLRDIKEMLLLLRVEDLQLGVKSYQKMLNITRPKTFRFDISKNTPYTAYNNPQGIIYLDNYKRNMLMRSNELYKFCDGTLTSVRTLLHDIASNLRMDYLPKRRWSNLDRKRSRIMIKAIDQQLFKRRLIRNLRSSLVGENTKKTSDCLNGQYDFVIFCPTPFEVILS